MAFPTSQKIYNVNFCTDTRVLMETEVHKVHVHRPERVNERTCTEHNCDLSACAHDARMWA
jgi:hypothetical protein